MDVRETSIRTFTGRHFDPWEPRSEDFSAADLGHHLSLECRFAGAVNWHYSVAQHSVLHSLHPRILSRGRVTQLASLVHDGSEAYIKDIPKPQKAKWGGYVECERRLMEFIYKQFNLPLDLLDAPIIKEIDRELFDEERRYLFGIPSSTVSWGSWGIIRPWDCNYARDAFNARLAELCN